MQAANRLGHSHHHVNRVHLAMAGLAKPDVCHREITPVRERAYPLRSSKRTSDVYHHEVTVRKWTGVSTAGLQLLMPMSLEVVSVCHREASQGSRPFLFICAAPEVRHGVWESSASGRLSSIQGSSIIGRLSFVF